MQAHDTCMPFCCYEEEKTIVLASELCPPSARFIMCRCGFHAYAHDFTRQVAAADASLHMLGLVSGNIQRVIKGDMLQCDLSACVTLQVEAHHYCSHPTGLISLLSCHRRRLALGACILVCQPHAMDGSLEHPIFCWMCTCRGLPPVRHL